MRNYSMLYELCDLLEGKHEKSVFVQELDMHQYINSCRTSGCAAGWAVFLLPSWQKKYVIAHGTTVRTIGSTDNYPEDFFGKESTKILGLDNKELRLLFGACLSSYGFLRGEEIVPGTVFYGVNRFDDLPPETRMSMFKPAFHGKRIRDILDFWKSTDPNVAPEPPKGKDDPDLIRAIRF